MVGAVCLLVVYLAWVVPYLRADTVPAPSLRRPQRPRPPTRPTRRLPAPSRNAGALRGSRCDSRSCCWSWPGSARRSSRTGSSTRSSPAIVQLHLSQAFAGLVIVAIAGNAVENTAGLVLAWKGSSDLAISVVKNSVAQIAAFLFPLLVLISFALATTLTSRSRRSTSGRLR